MLLMALKLQFGDFYPVSFFQHFLLIHHFQIAFHAWPQVLTTDRSKRLPGLHLDNLLDTDYAISTRTNTRITVIQLIIRIFFL